ncbi:MAG: siderophore-interacting protein [Sciscionella sp.]
MGHVRTGGPARRRVASTVATVAAVQALTPRMTRVRLVDDSLHGLGAVPGQTIKIYVPDLVAGDPVSRDYTVRDFRDTCDLPADRDGTADRDLLADRDAGPSLDIDFVLHGTGPAATWARRVQPGEALEFVGPSGRYRPDPTADWHVFAGDETALPAIQAYAAMLPADARLWLYLEVPDATEQQPIPGPARPTVRWLHRGECPAGTSRVLEEAVRAAELPSGRGRLWIAGHTPTVRRIRAYLLDECGLDRRALYVKGFWDRVAH